MTDLLKPWQRDLSAIEDWMAELDSDWATDGAKWKLYEFIAMRHPFNPEIRKCFKLTETGPELEASEHAVRQFQHKSGSKARYEKLKNKLEKMAARAELVLPLEINKAGRIHRLLRHGYEKVEHRRAGGWIFVVIAGARIKTAYPALKGKWERAGPLNSPAP